MNYDKTTQEFVLEPKYFAVLGAPMDLGRWPMTDASHLLDEVDAAQVRINDMDETQFPYGTRRHQMRALAREQGKTLRQIRGVIAAHVQIDDSELDRFFEQ